MDDDRLAKEFMMRKATKEAWEEFLKRLKFEYLITLNFNRDATVHSARHMLGQFFAHADRQLLGPRWQSSGGRRLFAVAFIEHPESNIHAHLLFRKPITNRKVHRRELEKHVSDIWDELVPSGSVDVGRIKDLRRTIRYVLKEFWRPGHDELIVFSTEFHSRRKKPSKG